MTRNAHLAALSAALLLSAASAHADSALLGGPRPGNQLDPSGIIPDLPRDSLSSLVSDSRSPTGLLYPAPPVFPDLVQGKDDPDWWSRSWIDVGGLGTWGKTRANLFRQYSGWQNGPLIDAAGFLAENHKTALYVSGNASNVARDDQSYQLKVGRYGVFDVTLFFDETPHLFSTMAKSLWDGVGTDNLTLKGGLVPGASTTAQVNAVLATVAPSNLKLTRDTAGFSLRYRLDDETEAVFQISNEWRDGTRFMNGTSGYNGQNGSTQLVQPIHYTTLNMTAALRYSGEETQANITYTGSIFRNQFLSLTWQNPGLATNVAPGVFTPPVERLSLPPNNEYHSLKADFAQILTPELRLTANSSYAIMRQDDNLMPPTIATGTVRGLATNFNLSQWNTVAALSTPKANAAIDIFRAFAQLEYAPASDVTLDLTIKDNKETNLTNYLAFNPQTGQYGYIALDGGLAPFRPRLAGVYEPNVPGVVVQIRNMPFANNNFEADAVATWRMSPHSRVDLTYSHNNIEHTAREVPNAVDNRLRLQYAWTGNEWGSLRASYEFAGLSGSDYTSNPYYLPFYSVGLPGYVPQNPAGDPPYALSNMRHFDIGNRREHKAHIQSNFVVSPKIDLQVGGDAKVDAYGTQYGLKYANSFDVNTALAYQLSARTSFNLFYSFETQQRSVGNITPGGSTSPDGSAGGPVYPLTSSWMERIGDHDHSAGFTMHQQWDDVTLDLNYTFTGTGSLVQYSYASTSAFNGLTAAQAGSQFPNVSFTYHMLEANMRWQYSSDVAVRLYYRLDYRDLSDYHYTGLTATVIKGNTYLGVVPENYTAQAVGSFIQYSF